MSVKKISPNKEKIYNITSIALNFFLSVSVIIFVVYLVAPLLGGKLLFNALILYGSWIGMALFLKFLVKRVQKGLRIRNYQYVLLCLYNIVCMFLWFPYPIDVILSVFSIVGIVFSYKTQQRRGNQLGHQ
jgi:hypothetical protein